MKKIIKAHIVPKNPPTNESISVMSKLTTPNPFKNFQLYLFANGNKDFERVVPQNANDTQERHSDKEQENNYNKLVQTNHL